MEAHGANGYLLDQFLQDSSNRRTDAYVGPVENRARLLLEVTDAVVSVRGAGRVGVHLAPRGDAQPMGDSNPLAAFGHVAEELGKRKIAFIFTREKLGEDRISPQLKKRFGGALIANEGFNLETASREFELGHADAISFGKGYIANPDLPERLREDSPPNAWHAETFYGYGMADHRIGYADYPASLPGPFCFQVYDSEDRRYHSIRPR